MILGVSQLAKESARVGVEHHHRAVLRYVVRHAIGNRHSGERFPRLLSLPDERTRQSVEG